MSLPMKKERALIGECPEVCQRHFDVIFVFGIMGASDMTLGEDELSITSEFHRGSLYQAVFPSAARPDYQD